MSKNNVPLSIRTLSLLMPLTATIYGFLAYRMLVRQTQQTTEKLTWLRVILSLNMLIWLVVWLSIIAPQLKSHFCSWMVVGAMTAKLNFNVESINLDRGEVGGYWKHSVTGTGNGSGDGYLILKFPKNISWNAIDLTNNNPTNVETAQKPM